MERDNAKNRRVRKKAKRVNRSTGGNVLVFLMLVILGGFMLLPVLYTVVQAFKPMEELFLFPPRFTVSNPTVKNFKLIGQLIDSLWVPFSRYTFNSVFVSTAGTAGNVIIASMAAYPLAKNDFPGKKVLFRIVTVALLFSGGVLGLAQYIIMAKLHMINTYWALILPSVATPMGLFLMKQFMEGLPTSLIEAAKIDGANEWRVFSGIVMPNVKPAWLTLIIFSVQGLWNNRAATFIYSEEKKTLVYALQQIQSGGIARTGQSAAVQVIVMAVPICIFILSESQILETMASSGLKD